MSRNRTYDPLKAGSIDGTDTVPHDRAVVKALNCEYKPARNKSSSRHTLFIGRLDPSVEKEEIEKKFSKCGKIKSCNIVRDIVTGLSKGYAFLQYKHSDDAVDAYHEMNKIQFRGKSVIVDWKVCDNMAGWVPRRLGGGWGGKKESGQLRFGCRDRPWKVPIVIPRRSEEYRSKEHKSEEYRSKECRSEEYRSKEHRSEEYRSKYGSHSRD